MSQFQYRIERNAHQVPGSDCWWWMGAPDSGGYGTMSWMSIKDRAHRWAYRAFHGTIPHGKLVLHSCDNKMCVNPDHLRVGTHAENVQEAWDRLRKRKIDATALIDIVTSEDSHTTVARRLGVSSSAVKKLRYALGSFFGLK